GEKEDGKDWLPLLVEAAMSRKK
ncbi:hypothetical protein CCACVL1_06640, partial [Corchorus capsularis]